MIKYSVPFLHLIDINNTLMIPKKLNYVWIGDWNTIPEIEKEWFETTKKNNPDFEIKIWSEKDVPQIPFLKNCLEQKLYWAAADYIRTYIMVTEGGFYLDTDVELIKSIPKEWLKYSLILPRETDYYISSFFIGAIKNNRFFRSLLKMYQDYDDIENPIVADKWVPPISWEPYLIKMYGQYTVKNPENYTFRSSQEIKILSFEEMCPYYPWDIERVGHLVETKNSVGIHYWNNYKKINNIELSSFATKFFKKINNE